jgi:K(+)-stimulated pyrophosphate-energized sodium pump
MENLVYLPIVLALGGLAYMAYLWGWVSKQDAGNEKMQEISTAIAEGALSFLKAEYRVLSIFVAVAAVLLAIQTTFVESGNSSMLISLAFIIGAVFSAVAGNIGMRIATKANVRTTQAARTSLSKGLEVSFKGGTVMGLGVAGLAVLGLTTLFIIFKGMFVSSIAGSVDFAHEMEKTLEVLAGF